MTKPKSKVFQYATPKKANGTEPMWQWIVIPGDNPYIYIPFPDEIAARQIGRELDRGEWAPESFIYFKITDHMRAAFDLPRNIFPAVPDMEGHQPWGPVSKKRWGELADDTAITRTKLEIHEPGRGTRTLYLAAKQLTQPVTESVTLLRTA